MNTSKLETLLSLHSSSIQSTQICIYLALYSSLYSS
jgi:hypothetical protein